MRPRYARHLALAALALVVALGSKRALAWDYDEHKGITCAAVRTTCSALDQLRTKPVANEGDTNANDALDRVRRAEALESLLCRADCGGVDPPLKRSLFTSPSGQLCPFDIGDAVSLVDNENDPEKLEDVPCSEVDPKLNDNLRKQAWEALTADEHFAPMNRAGVRHAYEVARARMLYAGQFEGTSPSPVQMEQATMPADESRQSLIAAARVAHLVEDAFSAGHNVARLDNSIDPRITTVIHDRYNERGVHLRWRGSISDQWFALGDHLLQDGRDQENQARVIGATSQLFCSLASIYVGIATGLPNCPVFRGDVDTLVPELVPQKINTLDAPRVSVDYMFTTYVHESDYVYRSSFHSFGATLELPFFSFKTSYNLALRLGPTIEVYSRKGARRPEVLAGETEHLQLRMLGGHVGIGFVTPSWLRALRFGAFADAQLGWHPDASISPANRWRWADGFNTNVNTEFLLYYAAVRFGWNFGYRRSALDVNRLDFDTGPSISVVFRPTW